jgi:hypothetical protein
MSRASRQRTFAGMGNQASRRRPLRFVVGYDGSLAAHNAIRYAAQRAGKRGHLSIVHAYDGNTAETSAEALLEAILLEGDDELLDTRYSTYAVHGGAAEALIAAAEPSFAMPTGRSSSFPVGRAGLRETRTARA